MKSSSENIKRFIIDNLSSHNRDIIHAAIIKFGLSRQAVLKHMNALIDDKQVIAYGKTRDRFYELGPQVNFSKTISINEKFSTNSTMQNNIIPHFTSLKKNISNICEYSIEALINNIIDHANATSLYFKLFITYEDLHIIISDNGEGLFWHIKSQFKLKNTHIAAIEVAKGFITTDPDNHSGDELKTVIHLFDKVTIDSAGKSLTFSNKSKKWAINNSTQRNGTRIHLIINPNSSRTLEETFKELFNDEYKKVSIPVDLVRIPGGKLINSREQAQSMLRNIADLKEIEFDFNNIDFIGPAFADELVRKTKAINKYVDIKWINCSDTVDLLMSRAINRLS